MITNISYKIYKFIQIINFNVSKYEQGWSLNISSPQANY